MLLLDDRKTFVYSVAELNRQIKTYLEQDVGEISVQGEISNLTKASSGHWYFTLKDSQAQLRCVFFRNRQMRIHNEMANGHQVVAQGCLSLYEARGEYQLIVETLSEAGLGDLHQQFELLKVKLAAAGLFDSARKKPLPFFPKTIGVITSPTGAALRDILTTLKRRYPFASIRIYPSDVQGKLAAGQLVLAVQQANQEAQCEVLILARGGGSLEDLWAFNDEQLAYAIAASRIPIVTGVGHETDVTIADFVADLRAPTPTAAAEVVSPLQEDIIRLFVTYEERLISAMQRILQQRSLLLNHQIAKLSSPQRMIARYWQSLDYLERQLQQAFTQRQTSKKHQLQVLWIRLQACHPLVRATQASAMLDRLRAQLQQSMTLILTTRQQQLQAIVSRLNTVSPLATLERGYALVTHDQHLLTSIKDVDIGAVIDVRLAEGSLSCKVLSAVSP